MPKSKGTISKKIARPTAGTRFKFQKAITQQLSKIIEDCTEDELAKLLETPRQPHHGEFALPTGRVKAFLRSVSYSGDLSQHLAKKFEPDTMIERVTATGGFINFGVRQSEYIRQTLLQVYAERENYGWAHHKKKNKRVCIDFSSPNIAKPFHAGHLRSTLLGSFCQRIHQAMGYDVVASNYLGDWGKQFGFLAVGYEKYGDPVELERNPTHHLYDVYVRINADAKTDPSVSEQANAFFQSMEEGDQEALALWQKFRQQSIQSYQSIYDRFGIHFDEYAGESQVRDRIPEVYRILEERQLLITDGDASFVDLTAYDLGKPVIRRQNGTSLYLTRDLAHLLSRDHDKMIYVVGESQAYYFRQLFQIYNLMFPDNTTECIHLGFGNVQGMSTRQGTAVFLEDILNTAQSKLLDVLNETPHKYNEIVGQGIVAKGEHIVGKRAAEYIADRLGISSVIIQDMAARRQKTYDFAWGRMTDPRGDTGVFLQYAHVRICGIERKANIRVTDQCKTERLQETEAFELAQLISLFPDIVQTAFDTLEPCTVVVYLFRLAHLISQTNYRLRVKDMDNDVAEARMLLFWAARSTLENGLRLVGIEPLERM